MAVIETDAAELPNHKKTTLSATPNTMQEFAIPGRAMSVEIQFESASGLVIFNDGTDDTVITSEVAYPVPADTAFWYDLSKAKTNHSIWVASNTGSTVVHVVVYEG